MKFLPDIENWSAKDLLGWLALTIVIGIILFAVAEGIGIL